MTGWNDGLGWYGTAVRQNDRILVLHSLLLLYMARVVTFLFQYGRLEGLVWLVRNTRTAERLQSRDGERSLLHYAAKYGQVGDQLSKPFPGLSGTRYNHIIYTFTF